MATWDYSGDAIFVHAPSGTILNCNATAASLFGYEPSEVEGLEVSAISLGYIPYAETDFQRWIEEAGTGSCVFEWVSKCRNGQVFWSEINLQYTLIDEEPHYTATLRDISARKTADLELRESEARYRELFNSTSSGVVLYRAVDDGQDFVFGDVNRAVERIESIKRDEIVGRRLTEVFPGVEEFGLFEVLQRVYRTSKPEHFATKHYHDERIAGWRDNHVYRLISGEVVAVYDDVTDLMEAERKLMERESCFQLVLGGIGELLSNSPMGMLVVENQIVRRANRAALDLLGIDSEKDAVGRPCQELVNCEFSECPVGDETCCNREQTINRADGTSVAVLKNAVSLQVSDRDVIVETLVPRQPH